MDDVRAALAQAIAQSGPVLRRGGLTAAESAVLLDALVQASMFEADTRHRAGARDKARQAESMADALGKALVNQGAVRPAALRKLQPFLHAAALALSREAAVNAQGSAAATDTDTAVVSERARAISAVPAPNTETLRFLVALSEALHSPMATFARGRLLDLSGVLRASDGRRLFFAVTIGQEGAMLETSVHFDAGYRPRVIPLKVDFAGDARKLADALLFASALGAAPGQPVDLPAVFRRALAAAGGTYDSPPPEPYEGQQVAESSQRAADTSQFVVTVEVPGPLALTAPGEWLALDRPA
jgi:hypothetical protein